MFAKESTPAANGKQSKATLGGCSGHRGRVVSGKALSVVYFLMMNNELCATCDTAVHSDVQDGIVEEDRTVDMTKKTRGFPRHS